jgi:hypothetical protein
MGGCQKPEETERGDQYTQAEALRDVSRRCIDVRGYGTRGFGHACDFDPGEEK